MDNKVKRAIIRDEWGKLGSNCTPYSLCNLHFQGNFTSLPSLFCGLRAHANGVVPIGDLVNANGVLSVFDFALSPSFNIRAHVHTLTACQLILLTRLLV